MKGELPRRTFLRRLPRSLVRAGLEVNAPAAYGLNELARLPDEELRRIVPRLTTPEIGFEKDGRCICRRAHGRDEVTIAGLTEAERQVCQWFLGRDTIDELSQRATEELSLAPEVAFTTTRSAFLKLADHAVCAPVDPL